MSVAKAWIGGAVAFLTALLTEWTDASEKVNTRDLVVALLAGLTCFGAVYMTPNKP